MREMQETVFIDTQFHGPQKRAMLPTAAATTNPGHPLQFDTIHQPQSDHRADPPEQQRLHGYHPTGQVRLWCGQHTPVAPEPVEPWHDPQRRGPDFPFFEHRPEHAAGYTAAPDKYTTTSTEQSAAINFPRRNFFSNFAKRCKDCDFCE